MGRRTCGKVQTVTRKAKYAQQFQRTEVNRKRKWKKHLKKHPNHIAGMEHVRKLLGMG
jgi:hypothetical protein